LDDKLRNKKNEKMNDNVETSMNKKIDNRFSAFFNHIPTIKLYVDVKIVIKFQGSDIKI